VALLGGETAEHGGVMKPDDLDVAGFAVGVVERGRELGPHRVREGDVLLGFGSPDFAPMATRSPARFWWPMQRVSKNWPLLDRRERSVKNCWNRR